MEWTREKTLSLISEYRKRRGLWDMTSDDYRKKEMKQKLLVEVSTSLGGNIPIVEIEKKFHTLRTQYHREINRMKRKEPYNSKWFGFKNLQFLSSPKACRSSKGRIKSEITEEGTVTTKYIIREASSQHDSSGGSANSSNNINEEFLTIHRKPMNYEASAVAVAASTSRSQELEKLIEETTKDVEEVEEAKPKMTLKEITGPIEHHTYNTVVHTSVSAEITNAEHDHLQQQQQQQQQQQHHQLQQQQHQQHMETDEEQMEAVEVQAADEEIAYQSSSSVGGTGAQATTTLHHHPIPTRIIKIQRRDTMQEEDYYDDEQQQTQHHIHSVPASTPKRIYYEANGQPHTATILTTSTSTGSAQANGGATLISPVMKIQHNRNNISQSLSVPPNQTVTSQQSRDEFATYGEYVANEMRGITNREILVALKHKINTALFEAHMTELQK